LFEQHCPNHRSKFNSENGFTTWRKRKPSVEDHENCPAHLSALLSLAERAGRWLTESGLVDDHRQQKVAKTDKKWRKILERIAAIAQTLSKQNLSLRSHRESMVGDSNPEKFLALLKYLENFDPLGREHLDSVSVKPGCL
jgi:hypothetical protein